MPVKGNMANRFQPIIHGMEVSEEGFTSPYALIFRRVQESMSYKAYLHTGFAVYPEPNDFARMHIKRIGYNNGDFEIDVDSVKDFKWFEGYQYSDDENNGSIVYIGDVNPSGIKQDTKSELPGTPQIDKIKVE